MYSVYYGLLLLEASKHLKWKLCSGGGGGEEEDCNGDVERKRVGSTGDCDTFNSQTLY